MTVLSAMPCWFFDKQTLKRTPSILDGIDPIQENRYRREGTRFIISVGTGMGLRYDTMATGVVYFHRFYMFHSFKTFPRFITACCCLFLAGKVEETPKKCKDIIKNSKRYITDKQFMQFGDDPKEEVMTLERILLQTIKFDLQVDHPYGYLIKYAKCFKGEKKKLENLVQMAWTFINDSLCTTLCLQWEPEVIAIALMHLAGKLSKFEVTDWNGKTSRQRHWWDMYVQDLTVDVLEDICHQVLDLYSTPVKSQTPDSPPATPPSKSTIRKVKPPASPMKSTSSSPIVTKPKEIPIGQPIPRLEPGELKRKASKSTPMKKDVIEAKKPRLSSASTSASSSISTAATITVNSPKKLPDEPEKKAIVEIPEIKEGHTIPTIDTAYHTGMSSHATLTKAEPIKTIISKPVPEPIHVKSEKIVTSSVVHKTKATYVVPETVDTYFNAENTVQPLPFPSNPQYVTPPIPLEHSNVIQQPPPPRPQYDDMYRPPIALPSQPPPLPPPPPTQYPPPPSIPPMNPYPAPPLPQSTILPNVSLPPPNLQLPPPPPISTTVRSDPMAPRLSGPPPPPHPIMPTPSIPPPQHMPPQNVGPRGPPHFRPRPDRDNFGHGEEDHPPPPPRMSMPLLRIPRPPRYRHDAPPRHEYYEQRDRPMPPHYRQESEYEMEMSYMEYEDYGNGGGARNQPHFEFENMMPRRYGSMDHPPPRERPPQLMNRPRMESPTGIPPVRITGRY